MFGIFRSFPPANVNLEIAQGNVAGKSHSSKIGRSSAVGNVFQEIGDITELSTLDYDEETLDFTAGSTLLGGTSGATAMIVIVDPSGDTGTLTIRDISGTFENDETITGGGGSAKVNGTITRQLGLNYPTAGQRWELICESTNDGTGGTGALTVLVTYLDVDYIERTEIKSLNGHTAVAFDANNALRPVSVAVLTWGSATDQIYGKTNLGSIVVRDSVTKDVMSLVTYDDSVDGDAHGLNNTQYGNPTIPAGKTGYITLIVTNTTKNHDVTLRSLIRLEGQEGFATAGEMGNYQNSFIEPLESAPAKLPEKTDVKFIARSNNTAVTVITQVTITLIDN